MAFSEFRRAVKIFLVVPLLKWTLRLCVAGFVLLALYLSLMRYYLPQLDRYKKDIEIALSYATKHQVNIGGLSGRLRGLSPEIFIKDLIITRNDSDQKIVAFEALSFVASVRKSILNRSALFKEVSLKNAEIHLHESTLHQWSLFGSKRTTKLTLALIKRIASEFKRVNLDGVQLNFIYLDGSIIRAPYIDLLLERDSQFRRLDLHGYAEASKNKTVLNFLFEGEGALNYSSLEAKWKLYLKQADLSALSAIGVNQQLRVSGQAQDIILNGRVTPNSGLAMEGEISLVDIQVQQNNNRVFAAPKLGTSIYLSQQPKSDVDKRTVWIKDFYVFNNQQRYTLLEKAIVEQVTNYQLTQFKVIADKLDLAALTSVLKPNQLFKDSLQNYINNIDARGNMISPQLFVQFDHGQQASTNTTAVQWRFKSAINKVAGRAYRGFPSVKNLAGEIWLDNQSGMIRFVDAPNINVHFPALYDNAFSIAQLSGKLAWSIDDHYITVFSDSMAVKYQGANINGWFSLIVDRLKKQPNLLSLNIGVKNLPVVTQSSLVPKTSNAQLKAWLNRSIKQGVVKQGAFLLNGYIDKNNRKTLLDEPSAPVLQLALDVAKLRLNYHDDWPEIKNADGYLQLNQREIDAEFGKANILGSRFLNAKAILRPVEKRKNNGMRLNILGEFDGSIGDLLSTVKDAKLSKSLSQTLASWVVTGSADTNLDLELILGKAELVPNVSVSSNLRRASLNLQQQNLQLSNISGVLNYSSAKGLHSNSTINAAIDGEPVNINIGQKKCRINANTWCTDIEIAGRLPVKILADYFKHPVFNYLQGSTRYIANIQIGSNNELNIYASSMLQGVTSQLPAPLAKQASELQSLNYHQRITQSTQQYQLTVGNTLLLKSIKDADGSIGYTAYLGDRNAQLDEIPVTTGELRVTGVVDEFDAKAWLPIFKDISNISSKTVAQPQQYAALTTNPQLTITDFSIANLRYGDISINDVVLNVDEENNQSYKIDFSSDAAKGRVRYVAHSGQPLDIALAHLDLSKFVDTTNNKSTVDDVDFSLVPRLHFSTDKIIWKSVDYGTWKFSLEKENNTSRSFTLENILGVMNGLSVGSADGGGATYYWDDSLGSSLFLGRVKLADLEKQLKKINIVSVLKAQQAVIDADLHWRGSVLDFSMLRSQGRWNVQLNNGSILKTPPTATGALKVLSLANLANILGNLKLDFSDLADEGLSFYEMKGQFNSGAAVFETSEPLTIKGSSSEINVDGFLNAKTGEIDAELVVTIPLRSNLPWIVGLAGGLPAAAGVFIASKLMRKTVDQLSSLVYVVKGDVDNPKVKFKRLFNLKLRKPDKPKKQLEHMSTKVYPSEQSAKPQLEESLQNKKEQDK